jgi:hypothetical protein
MYIASFWSLPKPLSAIALAAGTSFSLVLQSISVSLLLIILKMSYTQFEGNVLLLELPSFTEHVNGFKVGIF